MAKTIRLHRIVFTLLTLLCLLYGCSGGRVTPAAPAAPRQMTAAPTRSPTHPPAPTQAPTLTSTIAPAPSPTPGWPEWAQVDPWPGANQARVLLVDAAGDVWSGGPAGLVRWDVAAETPTVYTLDRADPNNSHVTALAQTPDGVLWVGTRRHGLYRFDGAGWQNFHAEHGLPGNEIVALAVDPKGALWINLMTGDDPSEMAGMFGQFSAGRWAQASNYDFPGKRLNAFAAAPDGEIWVSWDYQVGRTWDTELQAYQPETDTFTPRFSFHGPLVSMAIAPNGTPWVVTSEYLWRFQDGQWNFFHAPWTENERPMNATAMVVDAGGAAWFSTSFTYNDNAWGCGERTHYAAEWGVYRFHQNAWTHFTTADGLPDNMTCAITTAPDGSIWVGTADRGIARFDGNEWKPYAVR